MPSYFYSYNGQLSDFVLYDNMCYFHSDQCLYLLFLFFVFYFSLTRAMKHELNCLSQQIKLDTTKPNDFIRQDEKKVFGLDFMGRDSGHWIIGQSIYAAITLTTAGISLGNLTPFLYPWSRKFDISNSCKSGGWSS